MDTLASMWVKRKFMNFKIRYEDLKMNAGDEFVKKLRLLDIEIIDSHVEQAVEYSSFTNMQKMEQEKAAPFNRNGKPIFGNTDVKKQESFYVRQGKVGGYRQYLSEESVQIYQEQIKNGLDDWYGYAE